MQDMLVNLLKIKSSEELCSKLEKEGIKVSRAMTPDLYTITEFVERITGKHAKGEATVCFSRQPVSCFIATRNGEMLGYACYDATMRDYFGPTEVLVEEQGKGIGSALLLKCLESMKEMGYAYAIIGGVGPVEFYEKVCGAVCIPDTDPGIYKDML